MKEKEQQLFIPDKIKIGFQKREGTYTGKLAYIVYFDQKGELRKEKSWQQWRDNKIEPIEISNEPTEGFVLNKKVGGHRSHWNYRDAHVRVYDPRDFEFEISVPNLLFILREGDCSRGKGLEGKFVYAWEGTELVLLPVQSEDYKNSKDFTNLQDKTVKVKEMILGASYMTRKQEQLTYLGRFDYYFWLDRSGVYNGHSGKYELQPPNKSDKAGYSKKFVFWNGEKFVFFNDLKSIAVLQSDTVTPEYASLVDKYNKSVRGSRVNKLLLKEVPDNKDPYRQGTWYFEEEPGVFVECCIHYIKYSDPNSGVSHIQASSKYYIDEYGVFTKEYYSAVAYAPGRNRFQHLWNYSATPMPYREPTKARLFAVTENGGKFRVEYNTFDKVK